MKLDERIQQLRRSQVFTSLSPKALQQLAAAAELQRCATGALLLREHDPSSNLYMLVNGCVGVFYSSEEGANLLVKVLGTPAVFGEMELFFDLPRMEYVEAFEDSEVLCMPGGQALAALRANSEACYAMVKDLAARLCIAAYNERALAFFDVETRVAGLFLTFLDVYSAEVDGGQWLRLRLTYEMIARCLSVTVRSVERCLGAWLKQGWLSRSRGRYTVHDMEQLEARADPDRLLLHSRLGIQPHK